PSQAAHDFTIGNNLFYDLGGASWGGRGRFLVVNSGTTDPGPSNLQVDHNTVMQSSDAVVSATPQAVVQHPGFVFTNNLTMSGPTGVAGDDVAGGDSALATYFSGAIFTGNALVGGNAATFAAHPGNRFPSSLVEAGLPDPASGRLTAESPLHAAASDGKDIG